MEATISQAVRSKGLRRCRSRGLDKAHLQQVTIASAINLVRLDTALLQRDPARTVRIPQVAGERCLNLATAAGIALYEALRRISV